MLKLYGCLYLCMEVKADMNKRESVMPFDILNGQDLYIVLMQVTTHS